MAEEYTLIRPNEVDEATASPKTDSIMESISKRIREAAGLSIPSSVAPDDSFPDDETDYQARSLVEHYQAQSSSQSGTFKNDIVPNPSTPPPEGIDYVRDFTNFIFGDTAAALGVTWDKDTVNWSLDTARDMWTEHPYRAGLAMAADAGPVLAGAMRLARGLRGVGAEIDAGELVAKGLVTSEAEYSILDKTAKEIVQGQAKRIGELSQLRSAVDSGTATPLQKMKYAFHESFGNAYLEAQTLNETNPAQAVKMWHEKTKDIVSGQGVSDLLDLAEEVNVSEGTAILHAIKDPSQLGGLSAKGRELALNYSAEARQLQSEALAEGFIDQETVDKVGEIWFSTLRQDSPIFEEKAATSTLSVLRKHAGDTGTKGDLRVINVPRTGSANLKQRGLDEAGVTNLLKRQRASEALDTGNQSQALKLIKGTPEEAEVATLINSGRMDEAKKVLGKEGFVASAPKDLVVKSLIQQKLLLENFRTLRDVAMNPALTKSATDVAAMSKGSRRRMVSLDKVQNAGTLRRMVAIKQGKSAVGELGFIDQSLFDEVAQMANHGTTNQFASLLEFSTALLKTAKTALNPFTHVQNSGGNAMFLWMAGMDMTPENYAIGRQAWKSLWGFQDARKAGQSLDTIRDLGTLKSKVPGGRDIDIAEEMLNPVLSGQHGLLDVSSMEAAEGIPIMSRLYDQAGDHQMLMKSLLEHTQKLSKKSIKGLSVEKMSEWYMAEDAAAKLTFYLHLRQKGLTPLASANEVAKRLPMYGTVGHTIAGARKAAVPWISFPSETVRIMKNNLADRPLRTAMMMHAPNVLQAGAAMGPRAFGAPGMSYEEVQARREQNPMWAQKPSGVVAPSVLTDPFTNEANKGNVRTFMMDIMPWFATSGGTEAADASWQEKMPMGLGNPYPIILGFVDAITGKGQFGEDVVTDPNSATGKMSAIVTRTLGLVMPPVVQKYFLNPELPTTYYRAGIEAGLYVNPSTGQKGSPFYDLLLNNTAMKSYQGGPAVQVANERYGARRIADYRGRLGRELSAWTKTGDWQNVAETLRSVQASFNQETPDNPAFAKRKYHDWLKLHSRDLMKNPAFKGVSKAQFVAKITAQADKESATLNPARREYIEALRAGARQSGGKKKTGNPLTRGGVRGGER